MLCSTYYMNIGEMVDWVALRRIVEKFDSVWFPTDMSSPKFWFQARNAKFRPIVQELCKECLSGVDELTGSDLTPTNCLIELKSAGWSDREILVLAIMMDQMPRNALAINFGPYEEANRMNVRSNIDDSFALEFATTTRAHVSWKHEADVRLICFFSLIFRHSNRFDEAREVLLSLRINGEQEEGLKLPPLAEKFWKETQKRQDEIGI